MKLLGNERLEFLQSKFRANIIMYPTFKITKITKSQSGLEVAGNLSSDSYKNEKWVDNDWLGFLKDGNLMIYGHWKVCLECFEKFIKQCNFGFIVTTKKGQKLCV